MRRIMLTVAYDGTAYSGYQLQENAPTIEGEVNRCLKELLGEEIKVIGGSRTDAGVHALCNVAVFDTDSRIPGEKISYALNQRLPEDIRIRKSQEVAADFHPRHCESRKTYEYKIVNSKFPIPTKRLYYHFTYSPLDTDKMPAIMLLIDAESILGKITPISFVFFVRKVWACMDGRWPVCSTTFRMDSFFSLKYTRD